MDGREELGCWQSWSDRQVEFSLIIFTWNTLLQFSILSRMELFSSKNLRNFLIALILFSLNLPLLFFVVVKNQTFFPRIKKVISPDLIREVEARMNRNYLPPSLKQSQISGSPPSNSYVMPQQRRFGRACKLPTVQEVMGKSNVYETNWFVTVMEIVEIFTNQACISSCVWIMVMTFRLIGGWGS